MRVHAKETVEGHDRVFSVYYLSNEEAPFLLESIDDGKRVCVRSDVKKEGVVLGKGLTLRKYHAWHRAWVVFPKGKKQEDVVEDLYRLTDCEEEQIPSNRFIEVFPYLSDDSRERLELGNQCDQLQDYMGYKPTPFDPKGLHFTGKDDSTDTWLVIPFSKTRDSSVYEEEVFNAVLEYLTSLGPDDVRELSFNHYVCGWFNSALVNPQSDAHKAVSRYPLDYIFKMKKVKIIDCLRRDIDNLKDSLGDASSVTLDEVEDITRANINYVIGYDQTEDVYEFYRDIATRMIEETGLYTTQS